MNEVLFKSVSFVRSGLIERSINDVMEGVRTSGGRFISYILIGISVKSQIRAELEKILEYISQLSELSNPCTSFFYAIECTPRAIL